MLQTAVRDSGAVDHVERMIAREVGDALADHHRGDVGVGPDAVGHYRCVDYPQVLHPVDLAVLIDHGHRV